MNFPAMAKKTFDRLKDNNEFRSITKKVMKRLRKIWEPTKRAKYLHKEIDKYLEELFANPIVANHVSCQKGCTACCHTQVSITGDEAELLAQKIIKGQKIDLVKLAKQAVAGNDAGKWYQLPYNERGCVFLDESGSCTVYEDRPAVCRTNNVFSAPILCETKDGVEKSIRILNTEKADMAMIGGYLSGQINGALPSLLWEKLQERLNLKPRRRIPFEPEL